MLHTLPLCVIVCVPVVWALSAVAAVSLSESAVVLDPVNRKDVAVLEETLLDAWELTLDVVETVEVNLVIIEVAVTGVVDLIVMTCEPLKKYHK